MHFDEILEASKAGVDPPLFPMGATRRPLTKEDVAAARPLDASDRVMPGVSNTTNMPESSHARHATRFYYVRNKQLTKSSHGQNEMSLEDLTTVANADGPTNGHPSPNLSPSRKQTYRHKPRPCAYVL
ncbi:MAG: hypothetical protein M1827_001875 [Pycnora praestabilis]|nr:MAG: hypothetical protein M1827_001875 [Pycnora praestabilis]